MKRPASLLLTLLLLSISYLNAQISTSWIDDINIQPFSSSSPFPSNELNNLIKSRDGYVWICTNHGLYRYDGYQFKVYKNDILHPNMFTNSRMKSIAEDAEGNLWLGTSQGLNFLNTRTGETRQYHLTDFSNCDYVGRLLFTSSGQLWAGTEGGIYIYNKDEDKFVFYCDQMGNSKVPHCAIKWLHEDNKGYIWIGTWDKGLYRYNIKKSEWYEMPKHFDSAHVITSDDYGKIWVGTWGKGIYRISNPYDTGKPLDIKYYNMNDGSELASDYIHKLYNIDGEKHILIGTAEGLSLCSYSEDDAVIKEYPKEKEPVKGYFRYGVNSFLDVGNNNILISVNLNGLALAHTRNNIINNTSLDEYLVGDNRVYSVNYDHQGRQWFGLKDGLLAVNKKTDEITTKANLPLSDKLNNTGIVNKVFETREGDIIVCTTKEGMLIYPSGNNKILGSTPSQINRDNASWLHDNCIYSVAQDFEGNLIIGTWKGISVLYKNGEGTWIECDSILMRSQITNVLSSQDGSIWMTAANQGILCARGNIHNPNNLKITAYNKPLNTDIVLEDAVKIIQDSHQRIWVCSQDIGLLLYDNDKDGFICVNHKYSIPDDAIYSMEEAVDGSLWLSTRFKLIHLVVDNDTNLKSINFYTDNFSNSRLLNERGASASSADGELCFAGLTGYVTFRNDELSKTSSLTHCAITDIKVFNRSIDSYPEKERDDITKALPPFTDKITLDQKHNDLTLEFSTFNLIAAEECRFAYKLEGYDKDWVYSQPGEHSAYYSNLPSGTYRFYLRAADNDGSWTESKTVLTVKVLPPLWLRWWALLIYALLIGAIIYLLHRQLRLRAIQNERLKLAHIEREKNDELNHKKMQFFTNITHDLMTPLTVVSATVSELEEEIPDKKSSFEVVQNNLSRQMRLLQQILEFRKAETGNLHLRVSKDDICEFCRREVESITPLMKKKKIHLSLVCSPESVLGYFDTDALDKILYNLLSNAAKYNKENGYIQMNLTQEGDYVKISVKDDGQGISKEKQETLFTRFYEGEHRKFNTYGTGIGLSLTRDLVRLHHGDISVESEVNKGTTFFVTLPIDKKYYKDEEIDDRAMYIVNDENENEDDNKDSLSEESATTSSNSTILIVEDNDDILDLLRKLLSKSYNVLTAYNGKEGLEILENDDVDLIVSDIMMPIMDGVEMLQNIKNNPDHPELASIPVIMLTAKRDDQDRAEAYEVGADAYMTKPFNSSVLLARISNLIERNKKHKDELRKKDLAEMADINITDEDEDFLKRCVKCVQKHISDPDFDQQAFADEVGTSKSTLYKRLKALTDCNTSAFIRSIRMKTACEVLQKSPNIRISELAYEVGYNDPKYFSSCFKKDYGVLPTEYAKENSKKNHD